MAVCSSSSVMVSVLLFEAGVFAACPGVSTLTLVDVPGNEVLLREGCCFRVDAEGFVPAFVDLPQAVVGVIVDGM